ncbi:MAG: TIGR01777 family oxidoreductase [Bdellovibrionales bacterium]|nr:TIGR01777 family oxidoreductase [Bdellovibrionales bacterium]
MAKKILVTGATGLIGQKLCQSLLQKDFKLVVVGRKPKSEALTAFPFPCEYYSWDDIKKGVEIGPVESIVHLAGESIAEGRWTDEKKKRILKSRVDTTSQLVTALQEQRLFTQSFISTSAIGIYGNRDDEGLTEESEAGSDFLAKVCQQWETPLLNLSNTSIRVVILRFGIVLSADGGALKEMELPFVLGLGGSLGSGQQWMSWIHIDDLVRLIIFGIQQSSLRGPVNAVAPNPVQNEHFTKVLVQALNTSQFLPTPGFVIKSLLGEKSQIALFSQKVSCQKALVAGFHFRFENLELALNELFHWRKNRFHLRFNNCLWVPKKKEELFPFFSDPYNLEKITPPLLKFKVIGTSNSKITENTIIDYRLKIHGFPMKWRTIITRWIPPSAFTDYQQIGPYSLWAHEHEFKDCQNGTLMEDHVVYKLPIGPIGRLIVHPFVLKDINAIFEFRNKTIAKIFAGRTTTQD